MLSISLGSDEEEAPVAEIPFDDDDDVAGVDDDVGPFM